MDELDMRSKLSPSLIQALFDLKAKVQAAGHGAKAKLVADFATMQGNSAATVYGWLKTQCGYDAGRKPRADRGNTAIKDDTITFLAAAKRESMRGNGKGIMPTNVAMNVAYANGMDVCLSSGRINSILRERGLTNAALAAPRDTTRLRSLHPNHVHQIDPSLCVLFYMGGKQHIMDEAVFNKNKPGNAAKIKMKVWRYVRYDHASASIDIRYFEAAGENQAVLFDFLMWTWGKQDSRLSHGVPKRLLWDKGSANTSSAVRNLLDALGVIHETHAAGHAWAKGGVEGANNIVETHFESRLKIEPVDTLEQLNAAAEKWVRDYNANAIKHIDSRVKRDSGELMVRDDLWHSITAQELVAMPDEQVCRWFFHGAAQSRVVKNLQISFKHPELPTPAIYKLHDWATQLTKNEKVQVLPLLGKGGAVRIQIEQLGAKEPLLVQVNPVTEFDRFGRDASGQVIGEGYQRLPDSASVIAAKQMNEMTYGVRDLDEADAQRSKNARPFATANAGKGITAHSHLGQDDLVQRLPRAAQEIQSEAIQTARATAVPELASLSIAEACRYIKGVREAAGMVYEPSTYAFLQNAYPDGRVPQPAAEALAHGAAISQATGTHDASSALEFTGLRSVK